MRAMQTKLGSMERQNSTLQRRYEEQEQQISILRQEKADLEMALSQNAIDRQKVRHRYNAKVAVEKEKISHEFEKKLERDREALRVCILSLSREWIIIY